MEKFSRSFESFINHPIRFSKHFSRLEWYKTRLNRNSMSIEVLKDRRYNFLKNINNKFFAILARHARILPFSKGTVDYCQIIKEQKQSSAGATRRASLSFLLLFLFPIRDVIPRYLQTGKKRSSSHYTSNFLCNISLLSVFS